MCGQCCKCASPSSPTDELIRRAGEGDAKEVNIFAQEFLSIFIPYKTIDEARAVNPKIVERSINTCKSGNNKVSEDKLVFYHCKYISDDNKCLVHEDRPQLCRDYPDMPYLVFAAGCAYEKWAAKCKAKYELLKKELEFAKKQQEGIRNLKIQFELIKKYRLLRQLRGQNTEFMVLLPQLSLVSPRGSWLCKH